MRFSLRSKVCVWAVMVVCWLMLALAAPNTLNADAVSYWDIANSCASGNWHALVNGYWSPGYPFVLTLLQKLFKPGPLHEPLTMYLLAFVSLIAALIAFEHFLGVFFVFRKEQTGTGGEVGEQPIADDTICVVGYTLFFWISVFLIPPNLQQPDILVLLFYLLAASLCMQLVSGNEEPWRFALLGATLGLGYLVKAVMFPLGFAFIAVLFFGRNRWRLLPRLLLTIVVFAAVSSPFIFALSKSKGRLTYGDVGAVAYRHIMGWDVESQGDGALTNSICVVKPTAAPHILEYTEKISLGTYPPWADPSFDYKGAPLHFDLRKQINRTHVVLRDYFALYVGQLGALICGFLVLLIWTGSFKEYGRLLARQYVLWFPALAGLFLYSLLRVESRMLAGFTIGLFVAGAAAFRIVNTEQSQRFARSVGLAVSAVLLSQIVVSAGHDCLRLFSHDQFPELQVATALRQMNVKEGERVSYMGYALTDHAWAHLAQVAIAAEIPEEDVLTFWAADEAERSQALNCLTATGAKALVTRNVPRTALPMGWRRVGETDYYVLALRSKNNN